MIIIIIIFLYNIMGGVIDQMVGISRDYSVFIIIIIIYIISYIKRVIIVEMMYGIIEFFFPDYILL